MKSLSLVLGFLIVPSLLVGCSDPTGGGEMVVEKYSDGTLKFRGYMKDLKGDVKTGEWTYWHENGQKAGEGEYKNGKQKGHWVHWHKNGQKAGGGEYKNGKQKGHWVGWYENGQKAAEGEFKNGEMEGPSVEWHENGQKKGEGEFKNGKEEGLCTYWNEDGSIDSKKSGIYKDGKKVSDLP